MRKKCKKLILLGLVFSMVTSESNVSLAMEDKSDKESPKNLVTKIKINGLIDLDKISEVTLPNSAKKYESDFSNVSMNLPVDKKLQEYCGYYFSDNKKGNIIFINEKKSGFDFKKAEFVGQGELIKVRDCSESARTKLFYIPCSEANFIYQSRRHIRLINQLFIVKIKKLINAFEIQDEYELAKRICYFLPIQVSLKDFIKESENNKDEKIINLLNCMKKNLNEYIKKHENDPASDEYKDTVNVARKLLLIINEA